jgi:hypothetical protein
MHDIIGRIDYESNTKFLELKTKPSKCLREETKMNTIGNNKS